MHDQTVLFQTIHFNMSFVCTQFKCQTDLFDPKIGQYQVLPLRVTVDLGTTAMNWYSTFSKAPGLEPNYQIIYYLTQDIY